MKDLLIAVGLIYGAAFGYMTFVNYTQPLSYDNNSLRVNCKVNAHTAQCPQPKAAKGLSDER